MRCVGSCERRDLRLRQARIRKGHQQVKLVRRPSAAALGLALVVLAGCGGGEQPIATPSPTSSMTTTAASTTSSPRTTTTFATTATTAPSAGNPKGSNGAVGQVRLFLARYNQANLAGRIEFLDGLFTSACEDCVSLREKVAARIAKGIKPNGDIFTATDVGIETYRPNASPATATVLAEVVANPVKLSDPSGKVVETFVGGPETLRFTLVYDTTWQITRAKKVV